MFGIASLENSRTFTTCANLQSEVDARLNVCTSCIAAEIDCRLNRISDGAALPSCAFMLFLASFNLRSQAALGAFWQVLDDPLGPNQQATSRRNVLGYVKGICGLGPSPNMRLTGGTATTMTGPTQPTTIDQKMAGLTCIAQRTYARGF